MDCATTDPVEGDTLTGHATRELRRTGYDTTRPGETTLTLIRVLQERAHTQAEMTAIVGLLSVLTRRGTITTDWDTPGSDPGNW